MRARQPSSHRLSLLEARAAGMRRNMTESEARLWAELSGSKLGVAFRRQQVVLGRFIVDFLAPKERIIIEVDGGWHERSRRADACRDRVLESAGYRVVRFTAEEVLHELASVVERIRAELAACRAQRVRLTAPSPCARVTTAESLLTGRAGRDLRLFC